MDINGASYKYYMQKLHLFLLLEYLIQQQKWIEKKIKLN